MDFRALTMHSDFTRPDEPGPKKYIIWEKISPGKARFRGFVVNSEFSGTELMRYQGEEVYVPLDAEVQVQK